MWEDILSMYSTIFAFFRTLGLFPFELIQKTEEFIYRPNGFSYYFFLWNTIHAFSHVLKSVLLLATNDPIDIGEGYMLQIAFIVGCLILVSVNCTQIKNPQIFANTFTKWLRNEKQLVESAYSTQTRYQLLKYYKKLNWKFRLFQIILAPGVIAYGTFIFFMPKLPCLLTYFIPTCQLHVSAQMFLFWYETHLMYNGVSTTLCSALLTTILYGSIGNICSLSIGSTEELIRIYNSIELLLCQFNYNFSGSLIFQETGFLALIVLFLFTGIKLVKVSVLRIFFLLLAIDCVVCLVFLFWDIAIVNDKAKIFKNRIEVGTKQSKSSHERKISRTCRPIRVRPLGFHTITYVTFSDYLVFVCSMLLILVEI